MPPSLPILANFAQSFYSMILGLYLLSFFWAALSYSRFRIEFSFHQLVLSCLALFYTLFCLFYTFSSFSENFIERVLPIVSTLGAAAFLYYIETLESFFQKRLRFKKILTLPAYLFVAVMITDFILQLSGFSSTLFTDGASELRNWYVQNILGELQLSLFYKSVGLFPLITIFGICLWMLWFYKDLLQTEKLVLTGIILTLLTQTNDLIMTALDVPYLFPLAPLGYVCEIARFNVHIVEKNLEQNHKISKSLNETLRRAQPSRLTQQILHDSFSILRPFENLSEKDLQPQYVQSLALEGKRRLRTYEKSLEEWNSQSLVCINESYELALQLFSNEIRTQSIEVSSLPQPVRVYFHPTDLLLVFTNLIQNSLDAFQTHPSGSKWIRLEEVPTASEAISLRFSDSGRPPEKNIIQNLFKPGFSTKGEDRGLGLSLVREAMMAHGGRIYFEADLFHTSFRLEFYGGKPKSAHSEDESLRLRGPV